MTNKDLKQYLLNHQIDDGILKDLIDRKLYNSAVKEIPRLQHALKLKLHAVTQLDGLISDAITEQDKLDQI